MDDILTIFGTNFTNNDLKIIEFICFENGKIKKLEKTQVFIYIK